MVIKLQCVCGERLVAKQESAGKAAQCPSCGVRFRIPQSTMAALLDEEGVTTPKKCPDCMPPGAVVCIDCGYNKRLGRKMKTKRY
ncbi:MAG: hypothetical protein JXB62_09865 [Pirellulales bacterium]|nr:hypothetical protein [Pirellulales bacterium]